MNLKERFFDALGLGDPRIGMLKYLRDASAKSPAKAVGLNELKGQFGDIALDCVDGLIGDGYAAGIKVPDGHSIAGMAGKPEMHPSGYKIIEPYHITARGISRLKERRRNIWIFSISVVSLFVSFAALFQGCGRSETDKNSSSIVQLEESQSQVQAQILEEEERQSTLEQEIRGKLDELLSEQSKQNRSLEDLNGILSETQNSEASQP